MRAWSLMAAKGFRDPITPVPACRITRADKTRQLPLSKITGGETCRRPLPGVEAGGTDFFDPALR